MDLAELRVFLTVASERSFSRAAAKLHRTQPAVSQAIRRLEEEVGERLFDRSSKDGTLTEAGRVLRDYAERLQRLAEEAQLSVRELRDLQRGPRADRIQRRRRSHPAAADRKVSRAAFAHPGGRAPRAGAAGRPRSGAGQPRFRDRHVRSRRQAAAVAGAWRRRARAARASVARVRGARDGADVGVRARRPSSRTAIRRRRAIRCCGRPSCATRRSIFRSRCRASKGIKRAVEKKMGVALLPRRCADRRDRARPARGGEDSGGQASAAGAAGYTERASCRMPRPRSWRVVQKPN